MDDIEKVQKESGSTEISEENEVAKSKEETTVDNKNIAQSEEEISNESDSGNSNNIKKEETTIEQEVPTVAKANNSTKEVTYKKEDFIENAKALGYKEEVVIGALFNCEKTEMTKTEFEEIVKKFLGKKVK